MTICVTILTIMSDTAFAILAMFYLTTDMLKHMFVKTTEDRILFDRTTIPSEM